MINSSKKNLLVYIFVIACNCLLLFFILFNIYNLSTFNKYKNKLNNCITNIEKANNKVLIIKNGTSIDTNSIKSSVTESIAALSTQENSINTLKIDDRYKPEFDNLKLGVNNNIFMYKHLLSVINNLNSADINNSMKMVIKYKDLCNNYYSSIKSKDKSFSLSKQCVNNIDNISTYIGTIERQKKDNTILNTQRLEFQNSINDVLDKFNLIKVNLLYYAENARKKNITYDTAIAKVKVEESNFNDILMLFSEINVPEDYLPVYTSFKNVLSDYNSYLDSFYNALTKEKTAASLSDESSNFSSFYDDANKKFDAMNKSYNSLTTQLNSLNNSQTN